MKRFLVVAAICLGALTLTTGARGASLVYLDKAGDVALSRPDGSAARKIVANGFTKGPISVDGQGRIAYFYKSGASTLHELVDRNGKHLGGPYLFGDMGICGYVPPFRSAASPDGTWIAATYIHGNACDTATFSVTTRLIDADGPTAGDSVYGAFSGLTEPRFLPQQQPLLSGIVDNQINIWQGPQNPTMVPWIGLTDPNWDIDSFDYDPSQNRIIMEQSPAGNPEGGERRDFILLDFDAPAGNLNVACSHEGLVGSSKTRARPRYSPDGSKIAWSAPTGIFVSPAPTDDAGTCTLSPKLVVPGGTDVEWADFDLSQPPNAASIKIISVGGTNRSGFRRGMTVKLAVGTKGPVKVSATVPKQTATSLGLSRNPKGPVVVASGSGRPAKAGNVTVKLRPIAKAKAAYLRLGGVRVTVKATQGGHSATRTVKITR